MACMLIVCFVFFAVATPESNQQPDPNTSATLPLPPPYHRSIATAAKTTSSCI